MDTQPKTKEKPQPQPQPQPRNPIFNIDGVEYTADSLSDNAKNLIRTLRGADREIAQLEGQLTLIRIARQTVAQSLKVELEKVKAVEKK
jgi:hypothetical protein